MNDTVLLADADPASLGRLRECLRESGYKTLCAASQGEAERLLDAGGFDAAVLALGLEHGDSGFVLAYRLKARKPGAPVILLDSRRPCGTVSFHKHADPNGWIRADRILRPPLRPEQLPAELGRLLKEVKAARG